MWSDADLARRRRHVLWCEEDGRTNFFDARALPSNECPEAGDGRANASDDRSEARDGSTHPDDASPVANDMRAPGTNESMAVTNESPEVSDEPTAGTTASTDTTNVPAAFADESAGAFHEATGTRNNRAEVRNGASAAGDDRPDGNAERAGEADDAAQNRVGGVEDRNGSPEPKNEGAVETIGSVGYCETRSYASAWARSPFGHNNIDEGRWLSHCASRAPRY